jgi:hypothetical protein
MVEVTNQQSQINRTFDYNHTYSRDYDTVKQEFSQLQIAPINTACTEWSALARNLGTISQQIRDDVGKVLDQAWESKASGDAQEHLRVAQGTAEALANHSMTMARATDYAYQYAQWYQGHVPGEGLLPGGATQSAVDHLVKLMDRYDEVMTLLPPEVQAQTVKVGGGTDEVKPDPTAGAGSPSMPKGPGGAGTGLPGGGTGLPGGGLGDGGTGLGTGQGNSGLGNGGLGNGGTGLHGGGGSGGTGFDPYNPDSHLAGGGTGAGGIGGGLGSGGVGGGLGPGSGLGSGGVGGGTGGFGPGTGGAGAFGAGGRAGSGPGGPGSGLGGANAGRGAAGAGGAGAPHGGHGNGDEEEHERSTWLTEDEDVWGGNTDVPPPVIGG